jgi:energy-coupling factor transport system ATP-binding protein
MAITFQNVGYQYPQLQQKKFAISEIDLFIEPTKEFVAVIGHTGSGKSTLVQHMNALLTPTSGKLNVFGHEVAKGKPLSPIRKRVGMVFQFPEYQLFEETVERDIMFGPTNFGVTKEEAKLKAAEVMEMVGLDAALLTRSPFSLSGGQMRRVAIAGILAMEPDILILDEPTVGLDPAGQEEMMKLFLSLHETYHKTLIIVTHDMNVVAEYAKRVLVMKEGRLVFDGTPKDLFSNDDRLNEYQLGRPDISNVLQNLGDTLGITIPSHVITMDDAVTFLTEQLPCKS